MTDFEPSDHAHLTMHAQVPFPGATIRVIYAPDEIIHIEVDGHRYTFEIGSDDDQYVFADGMTTFTIPLMENFEGDGGYT